MIHKITKIIYITHVLIPLIYITHINYTIYITHMVKLIFKAYKKIYYEQRLFFVCLSDRDRSVSCHTRDLQILATELFKGSKGTALYKLQTT